MKCPHCNGTGKKERNLLNAKSQFRFEVMEIEIKNDEDYNLRHAFIDYWTEPNKSRTKMRFELQRTWETKRRLQTWIRNDKKFNPQKETETIKKMPGSYLNSDHFKERQSNSEPKKISELIKK